MVKKIMIVDDENGVTYTVKHGLEGLDTGYQVTCVDSGKKCLELLEQNQIPDLILLDIMMPEMTGWEVQKKIKEHRVWREIPVVFLTARTDQVAKRAGSFLGDDYIGKPFKIHELKQHIDKILQKK
jgi:CheY-like chemotaxis protein